MADFTIKIDKEDINTCQIGCNIMVKAKNNLALIFTPEALDELMNDYIELKKSKEFFESL